MKSIYKLDKKNYSKYTANPESFIEIYQKCLSRIGINLSKDWLNIKIFRELEILRRMKRKIKDDCKLLKWVAKKNIYDIRLDIGIIPDSMAKSEIDKWAQNFKKANKTFISKVEALAKLLEEKLCDILTSAKNDEKKIKELKSVSRFTINKLQIFKCANMEQYVKDIFTYLPYCNKKAFSGYDELYGFIEESILKGGKKYDLYDYAIYIWLLGEYATKNALELLEDIYIESYNDKQYFINTLATEAILKIGSLNKV